MRPAPRLTPVGPDVATRTPEVTRPPVLLAAPALAVAGLLVDLALGGDVGLVFGLVFVTACTALGLLADPRRFYVAALVPPTTMLACLLVLGVAAPAALGVPDAGPVAGVVAGFAHHSWALGVGYLVALAGLGLRLRLPVTR